MTRKEINDLFYKKPQNEVLPDFWDTYIKKLQRPQRVKTYIEEIAIKYINKLNWTNDTLDKDIKLFWMACHNFYKKHPTQFEDLLKWSADRHIHPRAFVKITRR